MNSQWFLFISAICAFLGVIILQSDAFKVIEHDLAVAESKHHEHEKGHEADHFDKHSEEKGEKHSKEFEAKHGYSHCNDFFPVLFLITGEN